MQPVAAREFVHGAMLFVTALCPLGIDLSLEVDTFLQPVAAREFVHGAVLFFRPVRYLSNIHKGGRLPSSFFVKHTLCIIRFPKEFYTANQLRNEKNRCIIKL